MSERLDYHGAANCRHNSINAKITIATILPLRDTEFENYGSVKCDEKQEAMNSVIQPSGPCFVPVRVYPPQQNIGSPDQQKHVVESQACAEFPANLLFGLSRSTLNRIRVAPVMRAVKCGHHMCRHCETADCPRRSQQISPPSAPASRQRQANDDSA